MMGVEVYTATSMVNLAYGEKASEELEGRHSSGCRS